MEAALGARTIPEDEPRVLDVGRRIVDVFPSPFFIHTWAFFVLYVVCVQNLEESEVGRN